MMCVRRFWSRSVVLLLVMGCQVAGAPEPRPAPTIILISLDGFRWDWLDRPVARGLRALAARGVRAEGLIPAFPTKTFPNHYTLVTGLYPDHHGVIANNMYDPETGATFRMSDRAAVADGRWWGGEPIWVTAINQGQRAAPMFWPGSEAEIKGVRPTYWLPYDGGMTPGERVGQVLAWIDLPESTRPTFLTLYLSDVDGAAHRHGTESPELDAAIARVDSAVGLLVAGLEARGVRDDIDLIVTSDHGLANTDSSRVILIDDYIDLTRVRMVDWSPVAAIAVPAATVDSVYMALAEAHPHLRTYKKSELPARLHFGTHHRVPALIAMADEGWSIGSRRRWVQQPERFMGATHGYDNALRSMRGIFLADGPSFQDSLTVPAFESIHVYELMSFILNLDAAPNDGDLAQVESMLSASALRAGAALAH